MLKHLFRFQPGRVVPVAVVCLLAAACSSGSAGGSPGPTDTRAGDGADVRGAEIPADKPAVDAANPPDLRDAVVDVMDAAALPDTVGTGDLGREVTVTGAMCTDLQRGAPVTPTRLVVAPTFSGGTPADGTYDAFAEEASLSVTERKATSLRLAAGTFAWVRFVESSTFPDDFEERSSGPYTVAGATITLAGSCGPLIDRAFMFTASGDEIALYRQGLLIRMRRRQ